MTAQFYLESLIAGCEISSIPVHKSELHILMLLLKQEQKGNE